MRTQAFFVVALFSCIATERPIDFIKPTEPSWAIPIPPLEPPPFLPQFPTTQPFGLNVPTTQPGDLQTQIFKLEFKNLLLELQIKILSRRLQELIDGFNPPSAYREHDLRC